jgi:hypothetical protein
MDARYSEVSADYVGAYCHEMKRQLGGEHLFLQGAIGGWVQPVEPDGETTPEKAETRGRELATQALQSLAHATTMPATPIRFRSMPLTLPLENPAWQQLAAAGVIRRAFTDSVTTEVAWFALGSAQFATHPGETAPYFGLETKKMMQTDGPKFILGLSQDALGYILKPVYFEDPAAPHAAYLTSMSTGPQTGPRILECLRALIPPAHPDGQ